MIEILDAVRSELQSYASRGIFQNFCVSKPSTSNLNFKFNWLAKTPFSLLLNTQKCQIKLQDVLPAVHFRSDMDKAFREFLGSRSALSVPSHRRLDEDRFAVQVENRRQNLSVIVNFAEEDAGEAARVSINLLHEIFNNFLIEGPYQNYMVEVFNEPEE